MLTSYTLLHRSPKGGRPAGLRPLAPRGGALAGPGGAAGRSRSRSARRDRTSWTRVVPGTEAPPPAFPQSPPRPAPLQVKRRVIGRPCPACWSDGPGRPRAASAASARRASQPPGLEPATWPRSARGPSAPPAALCCTACHDANAEPVGLISGVHGGTGTPSPATGAYQTDPAARPGRPVGRHGLQSAAEPLVRLNANTRSPARPRARLGSARQRQH